MSELRRGLDQLSDAAARLHRSRAPLPVEEIAGRARRRRRRREAAVSSAALAGLVVVTLGGAALLRQDPPTPPVGTPTPTAEPTATPTTTSTPTPTPPPSAPPVATAGAAGASPFACGEPVPAGLTGTDDRLTLTTSLLATEQPAGRPLDVRSAVSDDGGNPVAAFVREGGGPHYAVVRDGVVVATASSDVLDAGSLAVEAFAAEVDPWSRFPDVVTTVDLGACDPALAGEPLPAGGYELHSTFDVTVGPELTVSLRDADLDGLRTSAETHDATLVASPVAFTVVGEATSVVQPAPAVEDVRTLDVADGYRQPTCGDPAPDWRGDGLVRLDHPVTPLVARADAPAPLDATLTYTGPGAARVAHAISMDVWILRDGVVVGVGPVTIDMGETWGHHLFTSGAAYPVHAPADHVTYAGCDEGGSIGVGDLLPPGRYEALPSLVVAVDEVALPDGSSVSSDADFPVLRWLVGTPVPLTLE